MKDNKRDKYIIVKVTAEEHAKIHDLARAHGMTMSTLIRAIMIGKWNDRNGGAIND